jgi:hypothetical protein
MGRHSLRRSGLLTWHLYTLYIWGTSKAGPLAAFGGMAHGCSATQLNLRTTGLRPLATRPMFLGGARSASGSVVVGQCRPLDLDALILVSCDLCLDPAAQPRNRWPPATCYTADGSRWCAERKWLVVVRQCRPLSHQAQPRNRWPPATCYMADGSQWCAERKWLVVVRQCRPLNLDALILVSCELSLATLVSCELSLATASMRLCTVAAHPAHGPCCGSDLRRNPPIQPRTNASRSAFSASKNRSNRSYFT